MQDSQFHRLLFLLFFQFNISTAQLNQSNCSFYRTNETFFVKQSNSIIFQNDYPKIDQIGYDLFEKSFVMQNFSLGQIKSILILNSINFNLEFIYCFCQLLDNFPTQTIICIDGIVIDLMTNQYQKHKNAQITNIQIQTENENCDQIISDDRNQIKAYCQNSTSFILNYVNLKDLSSFQIISNKFINIQNCQRKFFNFQQEEYLSYYNCSDWKIYQIDKNKRRFQLILNEEIFINSFDNQIKMLYDVENCQDYLILIESNNYYQIKKDPNSVKLFIKKSQSNKILKIFFDDYCNIQLTVTQNFGNELIMFNKDDKEISIQQDTQKTEIFFYQKFLLIKRKNELQLVFSDFLKQTYTVNQNPLICMNQNELWNTQPIIQSFCYQIDTQSNLVIFNRLLQFKKHIKPTKQYLFKLNNFYIYSTFSNIQTQCYQILKDSNYTNQIIQNLKYNKLKVSNYCNSIHQFNFLKSQFDNSLSFKLDLILQKSQLNIDINDDFSFEQICKNFNFSNIEKIIWVRQGNPILLSFIMKDILYFYDCQVSQFYYQMNIKDQMILTLNDKFIIWKFNQKYITQLQFFNQISNLLDIPFEFSINNIIQCDTHLIIYFSNDYIVFSIYSLRQIQLNQQLKQYGKPIFYFERNINFQIIQFNDNIAIKVKNSPLFRIIEFTNKKITKIQDSSNLISIQTIHDQEELIQTFIYDGFDLSLVEQYLITDSQIYRPLIVSQSLYYTVLATTTNDKNSLTLFYANYQLKRIDIKQTKKFSFYINNKYLFYFDNQSHLRFKDLLHFQINLQKIMQVDAFDIYEVQFRFTFNFDKKIEQYLKPYILILKNECYAIMTKMNELSIQLSKINQIFKINQFFYGSVDKISADNQNISIQNPFDHKTPVLQCSQQIQNFCVFMIENQQRFLDVTCLLQKKENGEITVEFCKSKKCFQQFYIKTNQKLVCFLYINGTELEVQIFNFIVKQEQVIVDQLPKIKFYDNYEDQSKIIIIQCELLFIIINKSFGRTRNHFYHLEMNDLNYEELTFFNIQKAIHIRNQKNYFLTLVNKIENFNNNSSYQFIISYVKDERISISQQFILNIESFASQLLKKNRFLIEQDISIKFLSSCDFIENQLITYFLAQVHGFSLEVQLKYNFMTLAQDYQIDKFIRHPTQYIELFYKYYDKKILIITDDTNQFYLYDLTQDSPIYDHFYKSHGSLNQIYEFNTTHHILIDQFNQSLSIMEIGYKIIFQNESILNEKKQLNFSLNVENIVSQISVVFNIDKDEEIIKTISNKKQAIIALITITFTIFLILLFIQRRTYKQRNNKNESLKTNPNTSIELF